MTSPIGGDGAIILAAAKIAGVDRIFRVGGAQAIAALAFGTQTIPKVDKIVGPGNIYVATAKRLVFGEVNIDSIAGPSEILLLADESADPRHVAADMLSQAEHDELAAALCVTSSGAVAARIQQAVEKQLQETKRRAITLKALENYGAIIVARGQKEMIEIANTIAPEHIELIVKQPLRWSRAIRNAGAIFIGPYSTPPLGDYLAGPNHVLPTGGSARFFSPLGTYDFLKRTTIIHAEKRALRTLAPRITHLARLEGLDDHARAVEAIRMRRKYGRTGRLNGTKETDISVVNLDGGGRAEVTPACRYMLDIFTRHGLFDINIKAKGDIEVDYHHTVEDVGLALGQTFKEALGDKHGIRRFGEASCPLDETLAKVVVDLSGRPYLSYNVKIRPGRVGDFDTDLPHEFYAAFANQLGMNLHIDVIRGENPHHIIEACFKAFARAMDMATQLDPRVEGVLSTKGSL
jgi:imidazoleglycerol phosphate dehydratase HisB